MTVKSIKSDGMSRALVEYSLDWKDNGLAAKIPSCTVKFPKLEWVAEFKRENSEWSLVRSTAL